jgi:hypothetical protein
MRPALGPPWRRAFWLPIGAPLPGAPPCILQQRFPRTAGDRHGFPLRVLAWHRGAMFMCDGPWCMGLFLQFLGAPTPGCAANIHLSLMRGDIEVRHRDVLLLARAVGFQRLAPAREAGTQRVHLTAAI